MLFQVVEKFDTVRGGVFFAKHPVNPSDPQFMGKLADFSKKCIFQAQFPASLSPLGCMDDLATQG